MTEFDTITTAEVEAQAAEAVVGREREVLAYETNIANYQTILAELPTEWPERLAHLRGLPPFDAAAQCPLADIELLADLQQRDQIERLLKTEILECRKAQRLLTVAKERVPALTRATLLADAKVRVTAIESAAIQRG